MFRWRQKACICSNEDFIHLMQLLVSKTMRYILSAVKGRKPCSLYNVCILITLVYIGGICEKIWLHYARGTYSYFYQTNLLNT